MRTKTALLTAAIVAAGVASSMAQSTVYSLNIVGYVNVSLTPGYNLVANQLEVDGVDNVNTVLSNGVPDQSQLFLFNKAQGFFQAGTFFNGIGWVDSSLNPSTNNVPPGTAFFIFNPSAATNVTFVGSVVSHTNSFTITPGYGFYAEDTPVATDLSTNGFPATPAIDQAQYFTFSAASGYTQIGTYFNAASGWFDSSLNQVHPTPAVGSGFVLFNPNANVTWTQTYVVGQ